MRDRRFPIVKAVVLVMLTSVLAWAESLPVDFEFLVLLPFGVAALGLVCDAARRVQRQRRGPPARA
jgi:hypothetical protein